MKKAKTKAEELHDLAEMMRRGAKRGKQLFGSWRRGQNSCALGALQLENNGVYPKITAMRVPDEWLPQDLRGHTQWMLGSVIMYCNDQLRWTREKIADYIDCLAEQEEPN